MRAIDDSWLISSGIPARLFRLSVAFVFISMTFIGPVSGERRILQNDGFTGTATFTQPASFADGDSAAAVFTADPADSPFRVEIETGVTGDAVIFGAFERGDASCR